MPYRPVLSSPLKWAGGKSWLIAQLSEIFNNYKSKVAGGDVRLVDPFCGGMSIPLGLTPNRCLASDINPHLMNFWRWSQAGLEFDPDLGIQFKNDRDVYYENRQKFNLLCQTGDYWSKEGALLFYYLNRTGFNGLCRFNRHGYYNVPFGSYETINYKTAFLDYRDAMSGWELYIGDFTTLPYSLKDFIYLDPPYDNGFTEFAPRDFTWADQERLANWAGSLPVPVVASNLATPRIIDLYTSLKFRIETVTVPRRISCNGDRTPAKEMLAYKGM